MPEGSHVFRKKQFGKWLGVIKKIFMQKEECIWIKRLWK